MCTTPSLPVLAVTLLSTIVLVGRAGRLLSASHAHAPGPLFFLALVRLEHPAQPPGEVDDMPRSFKHAGGPFLRLRRSPCVWNITSMR